MKKNYVTPDMRVKAFSISVRLDSNSDIVKRDVATAGYTSINMTTVKTKEINWK